MPVCVAATVDDLQVLKVQISDSMSACFPSVVQHLKEVSSGQQNFIFKALDAKKFCCSQDSTRNFAYENELLKVRLDESEKRKSFLEKEEKDFMKILNVKMSSTPCKLKTSKMESSTKTSWSCQILTSSNPPLRNPNGNVVDNANYLEHLEHLNDLFISQISNNLETPKVIKNSKKLSINSKTLDLFNKTSIEDISIDEIKKNIKNIDQRINFNPKIESLVKTIAKQNKKLDDLFSKLSDGKTNITKANTPTKNIYEEKAVSEDVTKEGKLKKEKIAKKLDVQLLRKKYKEHYYNNHFSKIQPSKANSNNFSFTKEIVKTTNSELDDNNSSETRK